MLINLENARSGPKKYIIASLLACFLFAAGTASAGTRVLQEGESVYVFDVGFSTSSKNWDINKNLVNSTCRRKNTSLVQKYEYGYSYFHTAYVNLTLANRQCGAVRAKGLGDVEFGIRNRFPFNRFHDRASWEVFIRIPTGYDTNSASRLGSGVVGLGIGVLLSSEDAVLNSNDPWGWQIGTRFVYNFASIANRIFSYADINYAFTDSDFVDTGDFLTLRGTYDVGIRNHGVQDMIFVNQNGSSLSNSNKGTLGLRYSHSFHDGFSVSTRVRQAIFGKNASKSFSVGLGLSYRWRD